MALSKDIRERVIAAKKANEGSVRALAKRFSVGVASVQRLIMQERKTGSIGPKPYGGGIKPKIPDDKLPELVSLVKEKPDRTSEELRIEWENRSGVSLSRSAMVRALKRCNLTFKKRLFEQPNAIRKKTKKKVGFTSKNLPKCQKSSGSIWMKRARTWA